MTSAHLALALALAACGKADPPAGSGPAQPPVAIDVAAVNALLPVALRDRLVFERRALVIERGKQRTTYTLAAPAGWSQQSKLFAHLRPDNQVGFDTRFEVGSNCDGECAPKAWEPIADRVNFAPKAKGKIEKDERSSGRRTMIVERDDQGIAKTEVVVAWWADGARSYHTCTASLGAALRDAAAAFERACQAIAIDGDD